MFNLREIRTEFNELVKQWEEDNLILSFFKYEDPSYLKIIQMGDIGISLLFESLGNDDLNGWLYVTCLAEMTGERPWKQEDAGNITAIEKAWMEWGKEKGYLDANT